MEIILAIVVASAVILFGALISMGNERQRKAIDGLREQVILWAVQDLKVKQEKLTQEISVPDPLGWLNETASKFCGYEMNLKIIEVFEDPQILVCNSGNGDEKIIFSILSPTELFRLRGGRKNRLLQFADSNPLLLIPQNAKVHELSILNTHVSFDLELSLVWKEISGKNLKTTNRLWIYQYPKP